MVQIISIIILLCVYNVKQGYDGRGYAVRIRAMGWPAPSLPPPSLLPPSLLPPSLLPPSLSIYPYTNHMMGSDTLCAFEAKPDGMCVGLH